MEDVELREVMPEDLAAFFEQQREPEANQMAAFPARDWEGFMTHWRRILDDASIVKKSILVGDRLAGNVVSFEQSGERLVGYWLGREFWGRGIATEALRLFLEAVATRPLYARVAAENLGSIRVLEKCGFVRIREEPGEAAPDGSEVVEFVYRLER